MTKSEAWWVDFDNGKLLGSKSSSSSSKDYSYTKYTPCYESHKPLKIGNTGFEISGGSCSTPIVKDADIYIGFDAAMEKTNRRFPWNAGEEVYFPITDMAAPKDAAQFTKMVSWTAEQLRAGKKVHCGCIGGHGRTGTFLAALVKEMTSIDHAIDYVRENYCTKAVESAEQIAFLEKHFGVKHAAARKTSFSMKHQSGLGPVASSSHKTKSGAKGRSETVKPVQDSHSIWGSRCCS